MLPVSEKFLATVKRDHTMVCKAEIISFNGDPMATLNMTGGRTLMDYDAKIVTSGNIDAVDEAGDLTPKSNQDILSPFLSEVRVSRGVQYGPGDIEWCLLGTLRVKRLSIKESNGAVTIACDTYDRSMQVQQQMGSPYYQEDGLFLEEAIPRLVRMRLPTANFELPQTPYPLPGLLIGASDDTWDSAQSQARSMGFEVRVNRPGNFVISPQLGAQPGSRLDFVEGSNAYFQDPSRIIDSDDIPNVIIVHGTHPNAPNVVGIAADNDPSSDTYRNGPYGEHIKTIESEKVLTNEQAVAVATAALSQWLGKSESVELMAVPNPALDLNDIVYITREKMGLVNRALRVSLIEIPHGAGDLMRVVARKSLISIEEVILAQQVQTI